MPDGSAVRLSFSSFNLEAYGCAYDWVELRNGLNSNSPSIGKFYGSSTPPPQVAHSGSMQVTFKSDSIITLTGFRATFTAVPNTTGKVFTYVFCLLLSRSKSNFSRYDKTPRMNLHLAKSVYL